MEPQTKTPSSSIFVDTYHRLIKCIVRINESTNQKHRCKSDVKFLYIDPDFSYSIVERCFILYTEQIMKLYL